MRNLLRHAVQGLITLPFGASESPPAHSEKPRSRRGARAGFTGYAALKDGSDAAQLSERWLHQMDQTVPDSWRSRGGGGVMMSLGRVVLDVGGGGGGGESQNETHQLTAGYGSGYAHVGCVLFQNGFLRIFPLMGPGGMGGGADIHPKPGASVDAITLSGSNGKDSSLAERELDETYWMAAQFGVGLGIDIRLKLGPFGLLVGLRMGYLTGVFSSERSENAEPVLPPSGPFFRVISGPLLER
ncbi:MAG: hypothetical protein JW966_08310 [Anaerolineae bacterium]|nr:hypothetical protein [Anaerolineae bacterium]